MSKIKFLPVLYSHATHFFPNGQEFISPNNLNTLPYITNLLYNNTDSIHHGGEMQENSKTDFDSAAAGWDESPMKVQVAHAIAEAMIQKLALTGDINALDYGCGTGLVSIKLLPHIKTLTGMDSSKKMLDVLKDKISTLGLKNISTRFLDLESEDVPQEEFDLLTSSMVVHHVDDPASLFRSFYSLLRGGGRLCVADLAKEDGSFHGDITGIKHHGFSEEAITKIATDAGFKNIDMSVATEIKKENGKSYPVFLLIADKS
jgi:ubiquinone/menaquinone biosynthesis C-methylase UbiE